MGIASSWCVIKMEWGREGENVYHRRKTVNILLCLIMQLIGTSINYLSLHLPMIK